MRKVLEEKLSRFEELERQLRDPAVLADSGRISAIAREHGALARLATKYRRFKGLNAQIAEAQQWVESDEEELRELAESELPELREQRSVLWDELLELTASGDAATRPRCMMEIRAGVGGDEAALFARELYEMYKHYAEDQRWRVELLHLNPTELGGFKEVILGIEGEGAFRKLQFESGGHRVQRVPETEAKGRVHTSTATVAVMAEPEDVEITISPEDYRRDVFHASGPGGQHVNKTASAIRLTHLETGIVVSCQDEKSQHKNMAKALRVLKARLYEMREREEEARRSSERKSKVGSGDRSQKIRTYNFPQNRLTDHRINLTLYNLDSVVAGNLGPVIEALLDYEKEELKAAFGTVD